MRQGARAHRTRDSRAQRRGRHARHRRDPPPRRLPRRPAAAARRGPARRRRRRSEISTSASTATTSSRAARRAGAVHATHLEFQITGRTVMIVDDVLYTGRTVRAAIEALFDYGRAGRVQLAVLADRGHRELPIRPDYVGKNLPTAREEHVNVRVRELDGGDEIAIGSTGRCCEALRMNNLLSIMTSTAPPSNRSSRRPELRRGLRPRDQEGARAARADRPQPLLRGLHPHPKLLRAGRQAAVRRRRQLRRQRLERREGGVAEGHCPHAQRPQARRHRPAHTVGRCLRACLPLVQRRHHQRRRRQARASHAGPARRLHPSSVACARSTAPPSGSSATSPTPASRAPTSSPFRKMGARVTVAGPRRLSRAGSRRSVAMCATPSTNSRCRCRLRAADAARAYDRDLGCHRCGSTRPSTDQGRRLRRSVLMHPGPVNRGIELSGEVVDSPAVVTTSQVEAGVVVRMAVLYELLAATRAPYRRAPPSRRAATRVRRRRGLAQRVFAR